MVSEQVPGCLPVARLVFVTVVLVAGWCCMVCVYFCVVARFQLALYWSYTFYTSVLLIWHGSDPWVFISGKLIMIVLLTEYVLCDHHKICTGSYRLYVSL